MRTPHAVRAYPAVAPVLFAAALAPDCTAPCPWLPRVRWLPPRLPMPAPSAWMPLAGALVAWKPSCAEGVVQLKMADGRRAASSCTVGPQARHQLPSSPVLQPEETKPLRSRRLPLLRAQLRTERRAAVGGSGQARRILGCNTLEP